MTETNFQSLPLSETEPAQGTAQHIELAPSNSNQRDEQPPSHNSTDQDNYESDEDNLKKCRGNCSAVSYAWNPAEIRVKCRGRTYLRFNWITMGLSVGVIWSFIIWALSDPNSGPEIKLWQTWIVRNFAWFYSFALAMFMMFMLYIMFSPYGDIVLAPSDDEEPEFSYATWFSMLFSAGIAVGIFFYGVGEPIDHLKFALKGENRLSHLSLNEKATAALNLSWFHWGFAASSVYTIVGLPLAFFGHRKGMPMTIRTTFYALLGDDVNGPIGDVLDSLAVIGTMFGVATSLGIGILQLNTGLHRVFPSVADNLANKLLIMWSVTAVATISVMTGLKVGIRRLSEVNFVLGLILVGYLFFIGNSVFQLDLFVETIGYHIQWLPKLLLRTDSWERNGFNAVNYPATYTTPPNITDPAGWMSAWSTFYWAWWIAWSPFVGLFIASISRGRTIRQFIMGNMVVPTFMTCIILTVFGGLGLEIEMRSILAGYTCNGNQVIGPNGETTIPPSLMRISCHPMPDRFFDLLDAFPLSKFTGLLAIVTITTYFVTSSDSASHVIDVITSNGYHEPPLLQRVFWAIMEGAAASALLVAGGSDALLALQTASIAAGLPFTFVLIGMMFSAKTALDQEMEELKMAAIGAPSVAMKTVPDDDDKAANLLEVAGDGHQNDDPDAAEPIASRSDMYGNSQSALAPQQEDKAALSASKWDEKSYQPSSASAWPISLCSVCWRYPVETLVSFLFPCGMQFKTQWDTERYEDYRRGQICLGIQLFLPMTLVIVLGCVGTVNEGFFALAGLCALGFYGLSVKYRMTLRELYGIEGGILGDMGAYCCCYGCAIAQEYETVQQGVVREPGDAKYI